ncbi:MAG TPA: hypothetical protein VM222_04865 [Planctomycetota bacterium]|nr:hypothetical protein [Planctomycetota bacterium]
MKRLIAAPLLALLSLAGCMKIRQELLVMPDGSGRLTLVFSIRNKGETAKFTEMELMSGDPDEITDKVRGLAALTRPTLEEKDGVVRIRMTAYFDDVNALKFMDDGEPGKAKPKQEFTFVRDGEACTLEIKGNLMADEAPPREPKDPEIEKQFEEMFKATFAGFEFRHDVKLPGKITVAEGFQSKEGRVASYAVGEKDLQRQADQKKVNEANRFKASCGKSEVSAAEAAEFRKELDAAKAGWAALRKEMKARAEKK